MDHSGIYDICVIGAGMIGSSAAKYACMHSDRLVVCLIGPAEPQDRMRTDIFGAHYDEARITRAADSNPIWAALAKSSITNYKQIEDDSNIKFYNNVGCLVVGEKNGDFIEATHSSCIKEGVPVTCLDPEQVKERYPSMKIAAGRSAILQTKDAGTINPRKLVDAQQRIASQNGCTIIKDIVASVQQDMTKGEPIMCIKTDNKKTVFAKKVLIATGIFTNFRNLLPEGIEPDLSAAAQTVVFAEISDQQLPTMRNLPCYIYHTSDASDTSEDCYILPPVQYPDGKYYMKIGHGSHYETTCDTNEKVVSWFRESSPQATIDGLHQLLLKIFPEFKPVTIHADTCCTAHTPNRLPYIDRLTPLLGVALGGNGYAAKSCDELGRIAVHNLITGIWSSNIPAEKLKFKSKPLTAKI